MRNEIIYKVLNTGFATQLRVQQLILIIIIDNNNNVILMKLPHSPSPSVSPILEVTPPCNQFLDQGLYP